MAKLIRWTVKDLVECIDAMQENKFDCIMFIEGKRGLGKSTLAYKILSRLKCGFNPNRDIWYSRDNVIKALATKKKGVIFADELINVSYARDFYETGQKQLIKGLNMYRDSCNVFVGCIPFFNNLDKNMKELCKIRITVIRRGIALIHFQHNSIFASDPWDTRTNIKIEEQFRKGKPKYSKLTTVKGLLTFKDITPKQRQIYEELKEKRRNQIYNELNNIEFADPDKLFYTNLYEKLNARELTKKEFERLCFITGRKKKRVMQKINDMLKEEGKNITFRHLTAVKNEKGETDFLGYSKRSVH